MKSYNEMAASALQKIEEYGEMQEHRKKTLSIIAAPVLSFCLVALFGIGFWQLAVSQDTALTQQTTQNGISGTDASETTDEKGNDIIFINQTEYIPADKFNIELLEEDFVEMSALQLNMYFGINVFPTVPSDLFNCDKAEGFGGYGIYQRNDDTGEIYWDQNILNFSNNDFTRSVNIEISKNKLPVMDFGVGEETSEESIISGVSVYLGCNKDNIYQAKFIYKNTGFVLTTDGLSQDEVLMIIKSVIEQ